jgi:hypothetical protein
MQFWTLNLNMSSAKLYKLRGRNCRALSIDLGYFRFSGLLHCSAIISARKGLWRTGRIYSWSPLKALSSGVLLRQIYFPLQVCLPCTLPGFYKGCFLLEALRQSHLECLYSETCLTELHVHLESRRTVDMIPLNSSISSRFHQNTTIGEMLNELMLEVWDPSITHKGYYAACQPAECRYTFTGRNDAIYIVTTLIGLIGGLVTALRLIIPRFINFIKKCLQRRFRNAVNDLHDPVPKILTPTS